MNKFLYYRYDHGNLYATFIDNINKHNQLKTPVYSSNLCVTGDTKVLTREGNVAIRELQGKNVDCWNGYSWSKSDIFKTSDNQKVLKVNINGGCSIEATPYHRWLVVKDCGVLTEVKTTNELRIGDKLAKCNFNTVKHGNKKLNSAYEKGLFIPNSEYTIKDRLDWLAGYFEANGILTSNKSNESIQVTSSGREFIEGLQLMLMELGVNSFLTFTENKGKGSSRLIIEVKELYILLGLSYGLRTGMPTKFNTVVEVLDEGKTKETYCGSEPLRNNLVFNGHLTKNCTEVMIPSRRTEENKRMTGLCYLLSVNIYEYYFSLEKGCKEDRREFIYTLLKAVDNQITTDFYPVKSGCEDIQKRYRYIGIGSSNYATMLAELNISFSSQEAKELTARLYDNLMVDLCFASVRLAREQGSASGFQNTEWSKGLPYTKSNLKAKELIDYQPDLEEHNLLLSQIQKYGMRNCLVCAIAPTASSAKAPGLSEGIEPATQTFGVNTGTLKVTSAINESQRMLNRYESAYDISNNTLIELAAIRQLFIDQGQSVNCYVGGDSYSTTKAYEELKYAHDLGLKSLYYVKFRKITEDICESCS